MKQNIVGFTVLLIITLGCSLSQALPASELTPTANMQQIPIVAADGPTATIAATDLPTVIPLPSAIITLAPNLPRTAISIAAQPSPTVYNNAQPQITAAYAGCDVAIATGTVATSSAPYIKMNVVLASDITRPLATQVVPTSGFYNIQLSYPLQAPGTPLVISVGLWDGQNYVSATSLYNGNCIAPSPTAPVPVSSDHIDYFTSNVQSISPGGCVNVTFSVVGAGTVTLTANLSNAQVLPFNDGPNQVKICPSTDINYEPGHAVTLQLFVIYKDGKKDDRTLTITGTTSEQPPKIIGATLGCTSAIISGTVDAASTAPFVHVSLYSSATGAAPIVVQDVPVTNHTYVANLKYVLLPAASQILGDVYMANSQYALSAYSQVNGSCTAPSPVPITTVTQPATVATAALPTGSQPQPSPTVYNNTQPQIAAAYVGCTSAIASGTAATNSAPYIKMNVMLASDFTHPLATQVVPTTGFYNIQLFYPLQAPGMPLVLSVGLWDGQNYVSGTSLYNGNCITPTPGATFAPTGTVPAPPAVSTQPQPSPTVYNNPQPQITAAYVGCTSAVVSGTVTTALNATYIKVAIAYSLDGSPKTYSTLIPVSSPFSIDLHYPIQAPGTPMTLSVGLWDGQNYVSPTSLYIGNCIAPTPVATVAPTLVPTSTVTNTVVDYGTVSIPVGQTASAHITAPNGQTIVDWRWDGVPTGVSITDMALPTPSTRLFYLTPSPATPIGTYHINLQTHDWSIRVTLNVLACQETFQPGIYTLKAATDAASTYFSFDGPSASRGGLGDQRWFTFCASSQKRQLTLTLLTATGKTDAFNHPANAIRFYRLASWPLSTLSTTPLGYLTVSGDNLTANNAQTFTWVVQPGAYVVFFQSNEFGSSLDPSVAVTYSAALTTIK